MKNINRYENYSGYSSVKYLSDLSFACFSHENSMANFFFNYVASGVILLTSIIALINKSKSVAFSVALIVFCLVAIASTIFVEIESFKTWKIQKMRLHKYYHEFLLFDIEKVNKELEKLK